MTTIYGLYVPAEGQPTGIHPGSAIVGNRDGDTIHVHYEGSKHMSFDERLIHAAGRRQERYPTVAQAWLPAERLVPVGSVARSDRLKGWVVSEITDPDALARWVGSLPVVGGSREMHEHAAGLAWSTLSPGVQMKVHRLARAGGDMTDLILAEIAK